jgi:serine/threonine protein kinase
MLGPYRIDSCIGAGGMGEVYCATDTRLDRVVAIKILPPHLRSSPDLQARFEREARTISQLTHRHICTLHDVGHESGIDFLVMEGGDRGEAAVPSGECKFRVRQRERNGATGRSGSEWSEPKRGAGGDRGEAAASATPSAPTRAERSDPAKRERVERA